MVQSVIIVHTSHKYHLLPSVCAPAHVTLGICRHIDNGTTFNIVVENFGINSISKKDSEHLINVLQENYEVTEDWSGRLYGVITLKCCHNACLLDILMVGYVQEALHKFQHPTTELSQNSPHQWNPTKYGFTIPQMAHQI